VHRVAEHKQRQLGARQRVEVALEGQRFAEIDVAETGRFTASRKGGIDAAVEVDHNVSSVDGRGCESPYSDSSRSPREGGEAHRRLAVPRGTPAVPAEFVSGPECQSEIAAVAS
jgi:hypothetical protein